MEAVEENAALLQDGRVFIDRNPAGFPIVLEHLRNMAGGVTRPSKLVALKVASVQTVDLEPTSWAERRTLW